MTRLQHVVWTVWVHCVIPAMGAVALVRLAGVGLKAAAGVTGTVQSRFAAALDASVQRLAFEVARAFIPTLVISSKFFTAYECTGTALVTRFEDVKDVLRRDGDFEAVYGPRMVQITAGSNFILGMRDTPEYTRDLSNMRLAVRRDDVPAIVQPFAAALAASLVEGSGGRIDVPQQLSLRVPAQLLGHYFGTPGSSEADMIAWTTLMFWFLFADFNADPDLDARALAAAAQCRAYLDATIAARKAAPAADGDVLGRLLALQRAGMPGLDDLGIRNDLIGLVIGAVPTISKAAVLALDELLNRPAELKRAQDAARAGDDALLTDLVFEALRFNPFSPLVYRRATCETVIAPNTWRAITVPKSTMVIACTLSATFDRLKVDAPDSFRTGRPADNYLPWGDGLHECFGAHINRALIPAILKPLLAQPGLRRAPGALGQADYEGTPFPVHMWLEFGAA